MYKEPTTPKVPQMEPDEQQKERTMEYRIGSIRGSFPQKYIITKEDEGENLIFFADNATCYLHKEIAKNSGVSEKDVLGGGSISIGKTKGGLELTFLDYSTAFGGVPKKVLEKFYDILFAEYRKNNKRIKRMILNPGGQSDLKKWEGVI